MLCLWLLLLLLLVALWVFVFRVLLLDTIQLMYFFLLQSRLRVFFFILTSAFLFSRLPFDVCRLFFMCPVSCASADTRFRLTALAKDLFPQEVENARILLEAVDLSNPHEWFPLARLRKRKIIYHGGNFQLVV